MIKQIFLNGIEGGYFDDSIDETSLLMNPQIIKIYSEFGPFTCQKPTAEQLGLD